MDDRHFEAAAQRRLFSELPDTFVGTHAELGRLMSRGALQQTMVDVFQQAGARRTPCAPHAARAARR
eukprot:2764171-Prymnesium_polylepis.1